MNAPAIKSKQGFTIIEVVLVLAIAALIFLMVFIALPALQRNQRDTAAKQEVGDVLAALTTFQSNNRGRLPRTTPAAALTADAASLGNYLDAVGTVTGYPFDVANGGFTIRRLTNITSASAVAVRTQPQTLSTAAPIVQYKDIFIFTDAKCDTANPNQVLFQKRSVSVFTLLENGGTTTTGNAYCQNS